MAKIDPLDAYTYRNDVWSYTNLSGANMTQAILERASFIHCNFAHASMAYVKAEVALFHYCNFDHTDANHGDFERADFAHSHLPATDFCGANLHGSHLEYADVDGVSYNYATAGLAAAPEGELVGWGKKSGWIVKMLIPRDARRSRATGNKYRAEYVRVLSITLPHNPHVARHTLSHVSERGPQTVYEVGKVTTADGFDDNRWNECSNGIHFFLDRMEAVTW
jgi:hypothetical protein